MKINMKKSLKVFVILCILLAGFSKTSQSEETCVTIYVPCIPGHGTGGYIMICFTNAQDCEEAIDEAIDVMCP